VWGVVSIPVRREKDPAIPGPPPMQPRKTRRVLWGNWWRFATNMTKIPPPVPFNRRINEPQDSGQGIDKNDVASIN
jgi:hypothetical protein